jgi:hypothetical protein
MVSYASALMRRNLEGIRNFARYVKAQVYLAAGTYRNVTRSTSAAVEDGVTLITHLFDVWDVILATIVSSQRHNPKHSR